MHSFCYSSTLIGIEARLVAVEAVVTAGLPGLTVVGLPDAAVSESGARVRSALKLTGITLPPRRMVVNLSPADLRKSGSGFDLALALGLLEALAEIPQRCLARTLVLGELSLSGEVRSVRGIVSSLALAAETEEIEQVLIPASQAALLPCWGNLKIVPVESLAEAVEFCHGRLGVSRPPSFELTEHVSGPDLGEVRGQSLAKLGLEIAAAGGHHCALTGPPGCGKSLLASCLPGLLPPLTEKEKREVAVVASVCSTDAFELGRPFRAPGNSISAVALLGGQRPGEVTRAHHGVLFLDEFLEFRRDALEALRVVLESGTVTVARARFQTTYPAYFTLIAAMNPCPCGMSGIVGETCICSPSRLARYRAKLSGPLLDRFDMMVGLQRIPLLDVLAESAANESSADVSRRVRSARERQQSRGGLNRDLKGKSLFSFLAWSDTDRDFAVQVAERSRLSMRAFEKWLRVARTVADLQAAESVQKDHLMIARSVRYSLTDTHDVESDRHGAFPLIGATVS